MSVLSPVLADGFLPLCHMVVVGGLVVKLYQILATPWTVASGLLRPWEAPGKNTGVGCHFLLQGIFLTQGSNPGLLHCRQILYQLSYEESHLKCPQISWK